MGSGVSGVGSQESRVGWAASDKRAVVVRCGAHDAIKEIFCAAVVQEFELGYSYEA